MQAIEEALYEKLSGDSSIATLQGLAATPARVFGDVGAQDALEPFIVFQLQSGSRRYTLKELVSKMPLYLIKVVDRSESKATASAIDARIEELLNLESLIVDGVEAMIVRREEDVRYTETTDGVLYQHVGGTYRIEVLG